MDVLVGLVERSSTDSKRRNKLHFRLAEPRDAEAITALINVAFRKAEGFLIDRARIDLDSVREFLKKGKFLLAQGESSLLGCAYIEPRGDRAYLGLLSVDPTRQKAGLGSQIMTACEEHCAKIGCRFMDLRIVNVREELPHFYRRLGYTETGTEPFPPGLEPKIPCPFIIMSKPLC
jgi:N-acetylglutamate synthase-like GNAT family acetyltransferase